MQIPFGLRVADCRMVAPTEVPNGEGCGCVCPGCNVALVAKQGKIKEWHFAHARGADCVGAVESALHRMAKQLVMDRQQIYVPQRKHERKAVGSYDDLNNTYSWRETLTVEVQAEGLVDLSHCFEEQRVETRRPDILAHIGGTPVAIEVAFSHFCDAEKLEWLKERNLTTLEIDIGLSPGIPLAEIREGLEYRLFATALHSTWLYHAGDRDAVRMLDEDEQRLRLQHAESDIAFDAKVVRKKADKKRKDEFKAKIRDIEAKTIKLARSLTVRVAYSEIRCTMREHEFFDDDTDNFKQLIIDTAKRFDGRYNKTYNIWEFSAPTNKVYALYCELVADIEQRLTTMVEPREPATPPAPPRESSRLFRDDDERELFEELAAKQEFEARHSRDEAERTAFVEILKRRVKLDSSLR